MFHSFKIPHAQEAANLIAATKRPLVHFIAPALGILGVGMLAGAGLAALLWHPNAAPKAAPKTAMKNSWRESGRLGRKAIRKRQKASDIAAHVSASESNGIETHNEVAPKDVLASAALLNEIVTHEAVPLKLERKGQVST